MCPPTNDTTTTTTTSGTTTTNPSERNNNHRTTEHRPSHRRHHSSGDNRNNNHQNSHSSRSLLADAAITAAAAVTASADHHTILLDMDEHLQQLLSPPPPSRRPSNTMMLTSPPPAPISSQILLVDDLETNPNHDVNVDDNDEMMMKHHPYHHEDGCIEATIASSLPVNENEEEEEKDDIITTNRMDTNNMSWLSRMMEYIKYIYSTLLLLFSIAVVMYAICTQQTVATSSTLNIYIAILFFWICIVWLAIMEGTQGAVVGLQSVESHLYHTSHPRTFQNTQLIYPNHKNNNSSTEENAAASTPTTSNNSSSNDNNHNRLERFIIGRQFLVVLVVFILNTLSSSIPGATLFVKDDGTSFMNILTTIFLDNGVATILITIIIGQLIAQIVSSNCMLDFMNNLLVYGTEHISLLIESSGLLHAVYLFQIFFTSSTKSKNPKSPSNHNKYVNHDTDNNNNHISVSQHEGSISMASSASFSVSPPPTWSQTFVVVLSNTFFWLRVLLSVAILVFSFAVTITALVQNQTKMWDGVPISISIILFIILMMIVGMLEGLQIALFAVIRRTDLEHDHPMAYKNSQLILSKAQNLPAFLIGRQILVTGCTFIVARITAVDVDVEQDTNIFGVSDNVQYFFNTGLLGAVITTIMASLIWRIIAASYPVAFLSNPIVYILIRSCLYLEMSGICSSAWILAYLHKKLMNYKNDEVYIGSNNKSDDTAVEQHVNNNDKNCNNDLDLEENTPTPYH